MRRFADPSAPVVGHRDVVSPRHPLLAALPQLALALVVVAAGLGAGIRWPWVAAVAGSLAAVGLLQSVRAAIELGRLRRLADEWLLWGATPRPSSTLLTWRARELTSPRVRLTLAHSLGGIERELRGTSLPGPVPLNRRALRRHVVHVRALRERLEDLARPVSVRGMLLADRLLTEPGSPLYSSAADDVLAEALSEVLAAIDPLPVAVAA
ncbi:MAG TPA: hypothetical protein VLV28_08950 [Gaiellaceae bacterium]|nr:hypothetical protein [Gaiellaceae bacterium]